MEVRIEEWHGMNIRFVNVDGEWWCVYDDIISIIKKFNTGYCSHFERDLIDHKNLIRRIDLDGESVLIVNELGIYEILFFLFMNGKRNGKNHFSLIKKKQQKKCWIILDV